ncbi:MAG: Gfo/Idh/MocA family protein [Armatimonadota bacterium]
MRIAFIGAGANARHSHAKTITTHFPEHSIAGFCDLNPETAQGAVDEYGGKAFTDYREMLATLDCDAVAISVPHCLHRDTAVATLQAGKHVLLEKPMACTVQECDDIIAAQQAFGGVLMIGYTHHFNPSACEAREIIASGSLGKLVMGMDVMDYSYFADNRPGWYKQKALAGGGCMMNNGSHALGRIMFMTGEDIVAVYAHMGNARPDRKDIDVELHAQALVYLSGGAVISLWQEAYAHRARGFNEYVGTEGTIEVPTWGGPLKLHRMGQEPEEIDISRWPGTWPAEYGEFFSAIAENRQPSITGWWGRRVVEVAMAMYQSVETGKLVELPPARQPE